LTSHRSDFTDAFEVLVGTGDEQQRFTVHHELITKRSGFFHAARSERWSSGKPTDLHEHDPSIFDLYLQCVYQNVLPSMPAVVSIPPWNVQESPEEFRQRKTEHAIAMDLRYHTLTRLYILADSLLDSITANQVIDEIAFWAWTWNFAPGTGVIHVAFGSTREHDGLRNLLADLHAQLDDVVPEGDLPNYFLALIFERSLAAKKNGDIMVRDEFLEILRDVGRNSAWTRSEYYQPVPLR
jgi:hypothetical protein